MINYNKKQGLIKFILIFIILILILGYFNIDLRGLVEDPETQENFKYIKEIWQILWETTKMIFVPIWDNYLSRPLLYFWNNIFIDFVWESVKNLKAQSA